MTSCNNRNIYVNADIERGEPDEVPHRSRNYSGCVHRPASIFTGQFQIRILWRTGWLTENREICGEKKV
ncbi:unnamed protein product [Enterobius vermicularis]|uniref:Uncharacterized protein n=1 Tax=Enterobius vermicularis TaxID=51028 RepID=A0A0N4VGK1_ENTVE|nr:unnamed protein product [Enterobius vermicularis]